MPTILTTFKLMKEHKDESLDPESTKDK